MAALTGGLCWLIRHDRTPGAQQAAPVDWPAETSLQRATEQFTLLIFLHPHCPCSHTSLEACEELLRQVGGRVQTRAVFVVPPGAEPGWERGDLWERAARQGRVTTVVDAEAVEARRFGVSTSGLVLLYDAQGRLCFEGGITAGRNHPRPAPGVRAILAWVGGDTGAGRGAPVFGCRLVQDDAAAPEKGDAP